MKVGKKSRIKKTVLLFLLGAPQPCVILCLFVFFVHTYVNKFMKRFYCSKSNKDYKNI